MRRQYRMSPGVEVAEQRLSLSAIGLSAPNAAVATQTDQVSRLGQVVASGTRYVDLELDYFP